MMKLIIALAVLFFSFAADAGTISFTLTTASGTQTGTAAIADADVPRLVAAYQGQCDAALAQSAKTAIPPTTPVPCTTAQVVKSAMDGTLAGMMGNVAAYERAAAIAKAAATIAPIQVTPQP